jgi:hypothetical protein
MTSGIVADEIPVAFVGVELESEATHIALGVGNADYTGDRGETRDHRAEGVLMVRERGAGAGGLRGVFASFVPPCFDVQMGSLGGRY